MQQPRGWIATALSSLPSGECFTDKHCTLQHHTQQLHMQVLSAVFPACCLYCNTSLKLPHSTIPLCNPHSYAAQLCGQCRMHVKPSLPQSQLSQGCLIDELAASCSSRRHLQLPWLPRQQRGCLKHNCISICTHQCTYKALQRPAVPS
jgi:hypothetical protein